MCPSSSPQRILFLWQRGKRSNLWRNTRTRMDELVWRDQQTWKVAKPTPWGTLVEMERCTSIQVYVLSNDDYFTHTKFQIWFRTPEVPIIATGSADPCRDCAHPWLPSAELMPRSSCGMLRTSSSSNDPCPRSFIVGWSMVTLIQCFNFWQHKMLFDTKARFVQAWMVQKAPNLHANSS